MPRNQGQFYDHPANMQGNVVQRLSGTGLGDIPAPPQLVPQSLSAMGWSAGLQTVVNDFAIPSLAAPLHIAGDTASQIWQWLKDNEGTVIAGTALLALLMSGKRR